jgi:hypothetical protein
MTLIHSCGGLHSADTDTAVLVLGDAGSTNMNFVSAISGAIMILFVELHCNY